jgi:hypothetical protein
VPIARIYLGLLLLCAGISLAMADTLHVIALHHRPASELQPLIQPLLLPDEGISGSGYQLILHASESRRREIERLIANLDVAARQLTITLRQGVVHSDRRAHDAGSAKIDLDRGHIAVGRDAPAAAVMDKRGHYSLGYRGARRTSSSDGVHMQILRVQDGQRAFIRMGRSVPTVEKILTLSGRRAVLAKSVRLEDVTTGFDLLPRVHGDRVQLEITPRLASGIGRDGSYRFQELQTTVNVRLGEWIDLGELMQQSSQVNRAILQGDRFQSGERVVFSLKVD